MLTGIVVVAVTVAPILAGSSGLVGNLLMTSSSLLIVAGMFLIISGLSGEQFRAVNIRVQRYGTVAAGWFQAAIFFLALACAAILSGVVAVDGILDVEFGVIIPLVAVMLFLIYGVYELGSGPITIGVSSIRQRFNFRRNSAVMETLSLGAVSVCFMVAMASMHDSPTSMALGALLALIGYFGFKMKILDDAFGETSRLFYAIRNSTWRHYQTLLSKTLSPKESSDAKYDSIDAYRNLLISMQRTPVFSRRPVSFFGLQILCRLADAREMGKREADWIFEEGSRRELAEGLLKMSDSEFSVASTLVFDALVDILAGKSIKVSSGKRRAVTSEGNSGEPQQACDSDLAAAVRRSFINRR